MSRPSPLSSIVFAGALMFCASCKELACCGPQYDNYPECTQDGYYDDDDDDDDDGADLPRAPVAHPVGYHEQPRAVAAAGAYHVLYRDDRGVLGTLRIPDDDFVGTDLPTAPITRGGEPAVLADAASPRALATSGRELIATWQADPAVVELAHLSLDGATLAVRALPTQGAIVGGPQVVFNGTHYLIVWIDEEGVVAGRYTPGQGLDPARVVVRATDAATEVYAAAVDTGVTAVVWCEPNATGGVDAVGARLGSDGEVIDAAPLVLAVDVTALGQVVDAGDGRALVLAGNQSPDAELRLDAAVIDGATGEVTVAAVAIPNGLQRWPAATRQVPFTFARTPRGVVAVHTADKQSIRVVAFDADSLAWTNTLEAIPVLGTTADPVVSGDQLGVVFQAGDTITLQRLDHDGTPLEPAGLPAAIGQF